MTLAHGPRAGKEARAGDVEKSDDAFGSRRPTRLAEKQPISSPQGGNVGKENPGMEKLYDLVIKNARVVRPNKTSVDCLDISIKDGKVARLAPDIPADQAKQVFDAKNLLAFPGCVDAHMHIGIYAPLAQDAVSESKAAAMG